MITWGHTQSFTSLHTLPLLVSSKAKRIIFRTVLIAVLSTTEVGFVLPALPVNALPPLEEQLRKPPGSVPPCTDVFTCILPKEISYTDQFLRTRKYGLPYTPELRPLGPFVEVMRLNQLSQTMGYLNLFRATGRADYAKEAFDRVNYIYGLGTAAYGNGTRDGMVGYMFLDAYTLSQSHDQRYLMAGLSQADNCALGSDKDLQMNGGLMCALNLGYAYKLTHNTKYSDASRRTVQNTAPKQFADGAFPHLPTLAGGENSGYTSWMELEMLLLSQLDPQDPNLDLLTVRAADFISHRINPDGSLNFADANGNYDSDPGNVNVGFGHGMAEFFSDAVNLYATGHRAEADRALRKGFTYRRGGNNFGGYPDVYDAINVGQNIWVNPDISVLRTSLIFWYLSTFQLLGTKCAQGPAVACDTNVSNCSPQQAALGVCQMGAKGIQTCIAGRVSSCLTPTTTQYTPGQACGLEIYCRDEGGGACTYTCTHYGSKVCTNGICADQCYDVDVEGQGDPTCTVACTQNRSCGLTPPATLTADTPPLGICQEPGVPEPQALFR